MENLPLFSDIAELVIVIVAVLGFAWRLETIIGRVAEAQNKAGTHARREHEALLKAMESGMGTLLADHRSIMVAQHEQHLDCVKRTGGSR